MYYRHEKFFKHSLRTLVNIYNTASITIKNKKEASHTLNKLVDKKRFKNICDILLLKEALNANKNRV